MARILKLSRRLLISAPAIVLLSAPPKGEAYSKSDDVAYSNRRCRLIMGQFFDRLAALGLDDKAAPQIQIKYAPSRTSFDPKSRIITAPAWSQAPETLRTQVAQWASLSSGVFNAQTLFWEIYNSFMIAHESFHAYQSDLGFWRPETDQYESEVVANRGAVAFALASPQGARHLKRIMVVANAVLKASARPIPVNVDEREYFNANVDSIRTKPALHGWFEAQMLVRAWDMRGEMDFVTMVTQLRKAALPAS